MATSTSKTNIVLLVNLGSPEQLTKASIRKFLREFLSDRRVVDLPRWLWYTLLYTVILPLRAPKLIPKYRLVWQANTESPLLFYTKAQAGALQAYLGTSAKVYYAFCYGCSPSISEQLSKINWDSTHNLTILPLYPQYSSSTTGAVFDQVAKFWQQRRVIPNQRFIQSFASHPMYIQALTRQIEKHWLAAGRAEYLLVSFHSLPQRLIEEGDSYLDECEQTYQLLCQQLSLTPGVKVKLCFQSKFGRAKWVEPATDASISELAKLGVKTIDVICPGFVSDCLETLEEVAVQYQELFQSMGGDQLNYIPCLNTDVGLLATLADLCHKI